MPDIFISQERPQLGDGPKKKKEKKLHSMHLNDVKKAKLLSEMKRIGIQYKETSFLGLNYNPLSSCIYFPDNVDFENKQEQEKVVLILRRHPITNVGWIAVTILLLFAPRVLTFFPLLSSFPVNYQFIAILGWYLITVAYALEQFLSWFYNVNIITDERIVDVDFTNLIYKEVTDAKLDKIQDVTYKMGGVSRTLLNYGDVFVQTASEEPNVEFLAVPDPDKVVKIIKGLINQEEEEVDIK